MVGVASSAILGRRGLPAAAAAVTIPPPPPHPPVPLPPRFPLSLAVAAAAAATTITITHPLRRIRSAPHRVRRTSLRPLVCRVTFGLRAQPNLPGGRPGPPFSTNPGNEQRGSRGLLVAMATEPSPNPLDQTPIPYPSALRYPLPPPLPLPPRRARRSRCRPCRQRESLSIFSYAAIYIYCIWQFDGSLRIFCLFSCLSFVFLLLPLFLISPFFYVSSTFSTN